MTCLLITGFGPFPGAPFNPSGPLAESLVNGRRQAFASARLVSHVFPTSYQAVDRDLPKLIARHRPDAIVMFGLATRSRHLRIETLARNALSPHGDAFGFTPARRSIVNGRKPLAIRAPGAALLRAARSCNVPAKLSHDAGRYVCNYLYWRALEAAGKTGGPKLAVFVHIPQVARNPLPLERVRRRAVTLPALARSAEAILVSALASLRTSA